MGEPNLMPVQPLGLQLGVVELDDVRLHAKDPHWTGSTASSQCLDGELGNDWHRLVLGHHPPVPA